MRRSISLGLTIAATAAACTAFDDATLDQTQSTGGFGGRAGAGVGGTGGSGATAGSSSVGGTLSMGGGSAGTPSGGVAGVSGQGGSGQSGSAGSASGGSSAGSGGAPGGAGGTPGGSGGSTGGSGGSTGGSGGSTGGSGGSSAGAGGSGGCAEACNPTTMRSGNCASPSVVGRTDAQSGWSETRSLCGKMSFSSTSVCPTTGPEHYYAVYLFAGEQLTVDVTLGTPCSTTWNAQLRTRRLSSCTSTGCATKGQSNCEAIPAPGSSKQITAADDGWQLVAVDTDQDGDGEYTITLTLDCTGDCGCP